MHKTENKYYKFTKYKIYLLIVLLVGLTCKAYTQTHNSYAIIVLKTGEKIEGKITLKTEKELIVRTNANERFQFKIADIENIISKDINIEEKKEKKQLKIDKRVDYGLGTSIWKGINLNSTIYNRLSVSIFPYSNQNYKIGVGIGYEILSKNGINSHTLGFVPTFLSTQIELNKNKTRPLIEGGLGYKISTNKYYKGGYFTKIGFGIKRRISDKLSLIFMINGNIGLIVGDVAVNNHYKTYHYEGNTTLYNIGIDFAMEL